MGPSQPILLVAGVSGAGKSAVGRAVADALGWPFLEGDDLHPPANRAKMAAGQPLDDRDRAPWLARVAAWIGAQAAADRPGVVACSALRRRYRDRLRAGAGHGRLRLVLLDPPPALLERRLAARTGHFMPPGLLDSQLATLERPDADEGALVIADGCDVVEACDRILMWINMVG